MDLHQVQGGSEQAAYPRRPRARTRHTARAATPSFTLLAWVEMPFRPAILLEGPVEQGLEDVLGLALGFGQGGQLLCSCKCCSRTETDLLQAHT